MSLLSLDLWHLVLLIRRLPHAKWLNKAMREPTKMNTIFYYQFFSVWFFFYFSIFKWRNCVLQTKTNATVRVRLRFKTDYSGFLCRLPLVDSLFCRLFNCVLRLPSFKDKCETWTSFGWRIVNLKLNENKNESRISKKNMCAQNEMIFFFFRFRRLTVCSVEK